MTHAARIARDDAITDALRAVNEAIGDEEPTDQAFRIIAALKSLRPGAPPRVVSLERVDYLEKVQREAQRKWLEEYDGLIGALGSPAHDAVAGTDTPIGRLRAVTWRRVWRGGRIAWASEYYLNDEPITIAEIRDAGLAQRPTTRNRQKRAAR